MRLIPLAILSLAAHTALAGVAYRFETVMSGVGDQRIAGNVEAEGPRMRLNIDSGDGASFQNHSFVIVDASHIMVFDPGTKTYYDLTVDPLGSIKTMFGDASISNEHSSLRDLGKGHSVTTTTFAINIAIMDKKVTMHATVTTESWTTDKYPESASIGKVFSQSPQSPKGFPLKQVTSFHIEHEHGAPIEMASTTTVSDVVAKPIPATDLTMPNGYRKVESPVEKAMKSLGR